MKFIETKLEGAYLIEPERFEDKRGFFARIFCREEFEAHGLNPNVAQCNISFNKKKGTLRGMHYQIKPHEEAKSVRCTRGAIYDVIIDLRQDSPTYCQWTSVELTADNYKMLYIPEGFAHGFQTLEDNTVVFYQMSEFYYPESARGLRWNDPVFGIEWPMNKLIISDKDKSYKDFSAITAIDNKNSVGTNMYHSPLFNALSTLGKDEKWRTKIIDLCRDIEQELDLPIDHSVREEVTGPIIDALHKDVGTIKKVLKSGIVFEFKYRSKMARDFVMSQEVKPDHVWEPQTTKLLLYLATNAKHVVIGGAYFGDQAIMVAKKLVQSGGICHAFEPNKEQFAMLQRNAINNRLSNTVFNCIGLWENDKTTLRLTDESDDSKASSDVVVQKSSQLDDSTFPSISLNTYGTQHNIDRIDLIMLDIEGGELLALKGAHKYLSNPSDSAPNIIFEIHRSYTDWSNGLENTDIVKFLLSFGYHVFAIRDFHSNFPTSDQPIELIPPERTYLEGPPHGFNMLAVKNLEIIENDFFRICYDVSPKLLLHKDPSLHYPITELSIKNKKGNHKE